MLLKSFRQSRWGSCMSSCTRQRMCGNHRNRLSKKPVPPESALRTPMTPPLLVTHSAGHIFNTIEPCRHVFGSRLSEIPSAYHISSHTGSIPRDPSKKKRGLSGSFSHDLLPLTCRFRVSLDPGCFGVWHGKINHELRRLTPAWRWRPKAVKNRGCIRRVA